MNSKDIIKAISTVIEKEEFSLHADLQNELDVDSFQHAEIAFAIEAQLGRRLPDTFADCRTAQDIIDLVSVS